MSVATDSAATAPATTAVVAPTAAMRPLQPVAVIAMATAGAVALAAVFGQGLTAFFVFLLGAASFVVWLYRAYANLEALAGTNLPWSRGWALGGWFVPFVNLYLGRRVVVEVACKSVPADDPITRERLVKLARVWWAVTVALCVPALEWVAPAVPMNSATVSAFKLIAVGGAGCYIALVWWVTRLQEQRFSAPTGS